MLKRASFAAGLSALLLLSPAAVLAKEPRQDAGKTAAADNNSAPLPLEDLRTFTRVFEQIRASYVEPVEDRTLLENAIRGMLSELDPHSDYLDEKDFSELQSSTSGEFGGLGIEVGMEDGFVKVISPIDDTPAARAGIEAGDVIIKIDNKSVKGMSLDEAVGMMRGKVGSPLTLTILRKTADHPLEIKLKRDIIKVRSVKQRVIEPGYGYVRIAQFQMNTGSELRKAIDELRKQGPLNGLVLDLRNNPGGVLQAAVEVADDFLNQGLIVYTKGRNAENDLRYSAEPGDQLAGAPLVVLINDGSASASEIVAGALQDHRRAILIGTRSFGKGSVQTVIPISETKAIKLTTARYYTPSGRSIQAKGIEPDLVVERAKLTALPNNALRTAEADLEKHLANENDGDKNNSDKNSSDKAGKSADRKQDKAGKTKEGDQPAADSDASKTEAELQQNDNQLHDAVNVLKAMHLNMAGSMAQDTVPATIAR